jgi:hypothetical protein
MRKKAQINDANVTTNMLFHKTPAKLMCIRSFQYSRTTQVATTNDRAIA